MTKLIHRTIYFLLITLVINAGGWSFNKETVADVWFDEKQNCAVVDEHCSAAPGHSIRFIYNPVQSLVSRHWAFRELAQPNSVYTKFRTPPMLL